MRALLLLCFFSHLATGQELRWWKGNLHTHSMWSDGDDYPEMIAAWYKEHGYNFLALSDHNIVADHEKWITVEKSKGGKVALSKCVAKFGEAWIERRDGNEGPQVRLKMLSEFRPKVEEPDRFLMIPGEEISSRFLSAPIHINATNLQKEIPEQKGHSIVEVMQKCVDAVLAQREATGVPMMAHINHPNFGWAITAEELMQVDREKFFEVYNGHPIVRNKGDERHASVERVWDIILTRRLAELKKPVIYGLGTDDSHSYHPEIPHDPKPKPAKTDKSNKPADPDKPQKSAQPNKPAADKPASEKPEKPTDEPPIPADARKPARPGRGWVMVRAPKLDAASLIAAMEAGDFYASSGVSLKDVRRTKETLSVEIQSEPGVTYKTEFIGTLHNFDPSSEPVLGKDGTTLRVTRRYSKDIGAVLATVSGTSASYTLQGEEIYVRACVTSSKLKADPSHDGEFEKAWIQPLVPEPKK